MKVIKSVKMNKFNILTILIDILIDTESKERNNL